MSFEVRTTNRFERSAKSLLKRYRSLKADLMEFICSLESNPFQGTELSPGIRKIRIAVASKGRGKSGGARIITYTIEIRKNEVTVYLIDIYDKSDYSTVDVAVINKAIEDMGL